MAKQPGSPARGLGRSGIAQARHKLGADAALGHEPLVHLEIADGLDGVLAEPAVDAADAIAERGQPLLHGADHLLRLDRLYLGWACRLDAGRCTEQDALQQLLAGLAGEPEPMVVLEGHDAGARGEPHDAVAGDRAIAAGLELTL